VDFDPKVGSTTINSGKANIDAYTINNQIHLDGTFSNFQNGAILETYLSGKPYFSSSMSSSTHAWDLPKIAIGNQYDLNFELCQSTGNCTAVAQTFSINYQTDYSSIASYKPNYVEIQFNTDIILANGEKFILMRTDASGISQSVLIGSITAPNITANNEYKIKDSTVSPNNGYYYTIEYCDAKGNCKVIIDGIKVAY
jgi:hypothetical protein